MEEIFGMIMNSSVSSSDATKLISYSKKRKKKKKEEKKKGNKKKKPKTNNKELVTKSQPAEPLFLAAIPHNVTAKSN